MTKKLLGLLLSAIILPAALSAQSGKLAGKVTDSKTGEALALVNVLVEGTTMGAATNENGEYTILNVPPGSYTVKARYLGYADQAIAGIVVNVGLTKTVNFKLTMGDLTTGEVVVTAERPLVNPNATNSTAIKTAQDIENLPVRGVNSIVALQAGVVSNGGVLYIRGARADETAFYIDGVNVTSAMSGGSRLSLIDNSVEEIQVQTGGQGADYGGANGGVVSSSMKAGSSAYKFSAEYITDGFTANGETALGGAAGFTRGYNELVGTASGPIIPNLNFYVAGRFTNRQAPAEFWDGLNVKNVPVVYTQYDVAQHKNVAYNDTINLNYPKNRVGAPLTQYDINGNLTFNLNPFQLKYTTALRMQNWRDGVGFGTQFNEDKAGANTNTVQLHTLRLSHNVDPSMFYSVNFSLFDDFSKSYDPDYKDNLKSYSDTSVNKTRLFDQGTYRNKKGSYQFSEWTWGQPGVVTASYAKTRTSYWALNGQLTKQFGRTHEVKAGFEFTKYTIRSLSYSPLSLLQSLYDNENSSLYNWSAFTARQQSNKLLRDLSANAYGYDIYGGDVDGGLDGAKTPVFAAAFLEDKLEYQDLVLKLGLRYDYINAKSFSFTKAGNEYGSGPNNTWNSGLVDESYLTEAAAQQYLSPRVGLTLPVTDRTVFHANYGQYVQQTRLRDIYLGWGYFSRILLAGGNAFQSPVGFDLAPTRTTSYEIGFNQQVSDNASFDLTAFYNDKQGQIQIRNVAGLLAGGVPTSFYAYQNGDFATTSGVQATVTLRRTNRVSSNISYTYSDARGTGSSSSAQFRTLWLSNQGYFPQYQNPLSYNYTHTGSVEVDYRFAKNDGPDIFGVKALERFGINFLYTFNSGHPYTRYDGYVATASAPTEAVGTSVTPWVTKLNVKIDKSFGLAGLDFNAYLRIENFFNTKNVLGVFPQTGNADNDGYLSTTAGIKQAEANGYPYEQLYNAYNNQNQPGLFDSPRQVTFGLKVEF